MRGPPGVVGGEILLDAHFGSCGFVAANADFIEFGALPGRLHRCGQVYITVRAMYQVVSIPSRESALLRHKTDDPERWIYKFQSLPGNLPFCGNS